MLSVSVTIGLYLRMIIATTPLDRRLYLKGQESEWPNPQLSVGNCPHITKMHLKSGVYSSEKHEIFRIFLYKSLDFSLVLKHILNYFPVQGGINQWFVG